MAIARPTQKAREQLPWVESRACMQLRLQRNRQIEQLFAMLDTAFYVILLFVCSLLVAIPFIIFSDVGALSGLVLAYIFSIYWLANGTSAVSQLVLKLLTKRYNSSVELIGQSAVLPYVIDIMGESGRNRAEHNLGNRDIAGLLANLLRTLEPAADIPAKLIYAASRLESLPKLISGKDPGPAYRASLLARQYAGLPVHLVVVGILVLTILVLIGYLLTVTGPVGSFSLFLASLVLLILPGLQLFAIYFNTRLTLSVNRLVLIEMLLWQEDYKSFEAVGLPDAVRHSLRALK